MFKNPHPDHAIEMDYQTGRNTVTCSCGFTKTCEKASAAEDEAGKHFAGTRYGDVLADLRDRPRPVVVPMQVPAGLDAVERLNYRRGYSAACGKYLKVSGSTAVQGTDLVKLRDHADAWHAQHDEPRAAAAHRAGLAAVRAYWKRHGITDRAHLIGTVRAPAKAKTTTCEHCGQLTAVA